MRLTGPGCFVSNQWSDSGFCNTLLAILIDINWSVNIIEKSFCSEYCAPWWSRSLMMSLGAIYVEDWQAVFISFFPSSTISNKGYHHCFSCLSIHPSIISFHPSVHPSIHCEQYCHSNSLWVSDISPKCGGIIDKECPAIFCMFHGILEFSMLSLDQVGCLVGLCAVPWSRWQQRNYLSMFCYQPEESTVMLWMSSLLFGQIVLPWLDLYRCHSICLSKCYPFFCIIVTTLKATILTVTYWLRISCVMVFP